MLNPLLREALEGLDADQWNPLLEALPAQELVDLMINSRAIRCLESYIEKPVSLATPYQLVAYQGPRHLMLQYQVKPPLIELAINSDKVMRRLVEDSRFRTYSGRFPSESLLPSTIPLETMALFLTKAAKLTRITTPELGDIKDYLESVNQGKTTAFRHLQVLDYYSSSGMYQPRYPRELESILPDLGRDLFKNRLRSGKDYWLFLTALYEGELEQHPVITKLKQHYRIREILPGELEQYQA